MLDGGMGTMLQNAGLQPGEHPEVFGFHHPEVVKAVHQKYIDAGSRIIYANTFGGNPRKLSGQEIGTEEAVRSAVRTAREAAEEGQRKYGEKIAAALDIGPIGELLEPLGTVSFEEAYDAYREQVISGRDAGADLIVIETFTDLLDAKAAALAAKENSDLPVIVTMTFEDTGRTFTGTTLGAFGMTMEGLGVNAVGINCSLGPSEILPLAKELSEWTNLPLVIKPNAGLPDPETGEYRLGAEDFALQMMEYTGLPLLAAGGCCGSDPSYIRSLSENLDRAGILRVPFGENPAEEINKGRKPARRGICSATDICEFGGVRVIGERLNPTGKKKFQQALLSHDHDYICKIALDEEEAGADILDVNVGVPGGDEKALMVEVVKALQGVVSLPLQIDSGDAEVVEAALRVYSGRPLVNSVTADDERLNAFLPVLKKYGAATVGLCLDEDGIPETAEGRFEKAEYIKKRVTEAGIPKEDILIDCLTLTVSAQQNQARETLKALRYVHEELGLHACLGVSNISFGLPARRHITENFLIQAMQCGLDFPIINPNTLALMDAVASFKVLSGEDRNCEEYIRRFSEREETLVVTEGSGAGGSGTRAGSGKPDAGAGKEMTVEEAVLKGLKKETRSISEKLLEDHTEEEVINEYLIPALDKVGELYEKQVIFLPQLISSANAATAAFDMIKERIQAGGSGGVSNGTIVICTVKGDIHDIGKNIVKVILENYGYRMIDLGRDVPPERVVEAARESGAALVGLSALMTTTLPAMEETIRLVHEQLPGVKVFVGGAVLTPEYAEKIGADYYSADARESVEVAKKVFSEQ